MRRVLSVSLIVFVLFAGFGIGEYAAQAATPRIIRIAAGGASSYALFSDGRLYAWGHNYYGQLGDGYTENRNTPTLIGTGYTAISAGKFYTLALKGSGLYTWGENNYGQLGDGTTTRRYTPTLIGTGYTAIAAGYGHSLALKGSALYAWGNNDYGQLGDGTTTNRYTPTLIGTGYTAIAAGERFSLALKGSVLYTWGLNTVGQLGDGTPNRNTPTLIGTGYTTITAGSDHSFALKGSALYAWGWNVYAQLGNGTSGSYETTPQPIGTGYKAIISDSYHSLALKGSALYAWGRNNYGQLGDDTIQGKLTPIMIGTGYTAIAAGDNHSLALKGSVLYAWGYNWYRQLGDGTGIDRKKPTRVTFPAQATPDPLYISRFSVKKANLSVGDKATFTVETGKGVTQVCLLRDDTQVASTRKYKKKGDKRVWTLSPIMKKSGEFDFYAVASDKGGASVKEDVGVNVSTANLEVKSFIINNPALDVGGTVTFKVTTSKLATRVNILDASNAIFASSSKHPKTTSTRKIWTIKRKVTEKDRGDLALRAQIECKYGPGLDSETLRFRVTDNMPRIISVTADMVGTVKRGSEVKFMVMTNDAATRVLISNGKNEKWWGTEFPETEWNRRKWEVTTTASENSTSRPIGAPILVRSA